MFLHSVLLTNRAVVKAKLGKTDDAITDCSRALEEDARFVALLRFSAIAPNL